mgnify:CR=1 FL=1
MANLPAYYRIEDEESFTDFQNALEDYAPRIAHLLSALRQKPGDTALLGELMRLLHTIKGDAGLCRLGFVAPLLHGMEEVLVRVRSGELLFSYNIEQVLFLALDRLELLMQTLELHSEATLADFHLLCHELTQVAQTAPAALDGWRRASLAAIKAGASRFLAPPVCHRHNVCCAINCLQAGTQNDRFRQSSVRTRQIVEFRCSSDLQG